MMVYDWEGEVKKFLLAGIAFGALALPAAAADMPVKAPAPVPIDVWTGGYVGANVGYDWGHDSVQSAGSPGACSSTLGECAVGNNQSPNQARALTFQTSINRSGVIYGGQAGHNWLVRGIFASDRIGTWDGVLGVEVDFQGKSDSSSTALTSVFPQAFAPANPLSQTATLSERIDTLGTVRGRAGVLWGPSTLLYATGGLAWASVKATDTFTQFVNGAVAAPNLPGTGSGTFNSERFGPVFGGGIEWKWTANWSVKAEYLYADLGDIAITTGAIQPFAFNGVSGTAIAQTTSHVRENIARVGVNYRFW
jgi:outer membrane immunogenic protein